MIGSNLVDDLLRNLDPEIRTHAARCKCQVTFRFGNSGMLTSQQALILPIGDLRLKIAIVEGGTPLLLSNTLLRALGSTIDTTRQEIQCRRLQKTIPLQLTKNGLFLLDLNQVCGVPSKADRVEATFVTDSSGCKRLPESAAKIELEQGNTHEGPQSPEFRNDVTPTTGSSEVSQTIQSCDHGSQGGTASALAGAADASRDGPSRLDPVLPGRDGQHEGDVRREVEGLHISAGVGGLCHVAWFLGKYQESPKLDHRLFMTFIESMVDQAELRGHSIPKNVPISETVHSQNLTTGSPTSEVMTEPKRIMKTATKSKVIPKRQPPVVKEELNAWDAAEWSDALGSQPSPVESAESQQAEIQNLHGRMLQMETVMMEVVERLRQMHVAGTFPGEQP